MKLAVRGDRTQKDKLVSILREMGGFFPLPIGVPSESDWYFLDNQDFVRIHWCRLHLESLGYECITIEEYDRRKENSIT